MTDGSYLDGLAHLYLVVNDYLWRSCSLDRQRPPDTPSSLLHMSHLPHTGSGRLLSNRHWRRFGHWGLFGRSDSRRRSSYLGLTEGSGRGERSWDRNTSTSTLHSGHSAGHRLVKGVSCYRRRSLAYWSYFHVAGKFPG